MLGSVTKFRRGRRDCRRAARAKSALFAAAIFSRRSAMQRPWWLLLARAAWAFPALPAGGVFNPTYDWQAIPDGQSVPAGLEIKMEMQVEGAARVPRVARIPPSWKLQLWIGTDRFFARVDVTREMTIANVEAAINAEVNAKHDARHDGNAGCPVTLWSNGARLPPASTAEATSLFSLQRTLVPTAECAKAEQLSTRRKRTGRLRRRHDG